MSTTIEKLRLKSQVPLIRHTQLDSLMLQAANELAQLTANLADLMKDKERLDWLRNNLTTHHKWELFGNTLFYANKSFNETIDAAENGVK